MVDEAARVLMLDGGTLTLEDLARAARDPRVRVACTPQSMDRVEASRRQVDEVVRRYEAEHRAYRAAKAGDAKGATKPVQDYGITTGFGEFKNIPIEPEDLGPLQKNLLISHAIGVGDTAEADDPSNYFTAEVVRAALITRLNGALKGHSGVQRELVEAVQAMINQGIVPQVPIRGSVGASGDLCPLAHLFAVLVGHGKYHVVHAADDMGLPPRVWKDASELAEDLGMKPPELLHKEGLALINGVNISVAVLALAVFDADVACNTADVAAALCLEAMCGCARALDPKVHAARGYDGQTCSAARLRALLEGSTLLESAGAVQDVYSLRCAPVVHGASRDAITYVRGIVETEINAATDNPLLFGDGEEAWDHSFEANWPEGYDGRRRASYSAGNFHGQPLALAADFLAIAAAELANISERRCQLLLDSSQSRGLPANLVPQRGVNSGYMIAQYTAASLVSENKSLAHPASVDSIPTAANSEDHVSMSTIAARKARTILGNLQVVLAMELMVVAQAVEWRTAMDCPPVIGGEPVREGRKLAKKDWSAAEAEAEAFLSSTRDAQRNAIAERLGRGTAEAYRTIRKAVPPLCQDRAMADDVRALRKLIAAGALSASGAGQ